MYIITATLNGAKYYYDGCHFTQSAEFSELFLDVVDATLEMISLGTYINPMFRNVKVEEI